MPLPRDVQQSKAQLGYGKSSVACLSVCGIGVPLSWFNRIHENLPIIANRSQQAQSALGYGVGIIPEFQVEYECGRQHVALCGFLTTARLSCMF